MLVIYYSTDIQTRNNDITLKAFYLLKLLFQAPDLLTVLHRPSFSVHFSQYWHCFPPALPLYVLGYWYCHPMPEYTTRIIYWFWKGKIRICQMSVYKADLLSVAHLLLWRRRDKKIVFTATTRVIGVLYNHQFEISLSKLKWINPFHFSLLPQTEN